MSWWELGEGSGFHGTDLSLYEIECAFCGERGNWALVFHEEKKKPSGHKTLNFDVYRCGNCAGFVHVLWSSSGYTHGIHAFKVLPWPIGKPRPSKNWPTQVQSYWAQARQSENSEAWDAASVMARSALQVALREQGAAGRTLRDEISDLAGKGILPPTMREWATEVRLLGNESAHPEASSSGADAQDVRDAIKFLTLMLHYLYDVPAEINEYRERRAAREQPRPSQTGPAT